VKLPARGRAAILLACSLTHLASAGCAPTYGDAYLASFAAGQRAAQAGRHDEAARAFGEAAAKARRVKDRDEARFLQARSLERSSRPEDARAIYEKLSEQRGPRTGRAEFEIASLDIERGDPHGWDRLYAAAKKYPQHGLARRAVQRLAAREAEERGEEARLAWLKAHASDLTGTDLEQVIEYESALSLDRLGRAALAHDAFLATAARYPYPFGVYTDDAIWNAALIDERLGRPEEAIEHLRRLLAAREVSTTMGSYERPRYSEAQLKIAEIYRDKIKDRAAARRELHKLYERHTTSTLRDDALWAEAVLLHEDKDERGACAAVATLAKEFPDSRYARCGRELCPSAPEPKRACADYIVRELRGGAGEPADKEDAEEGETSSAEGGDGE
jgi:tetratricopeptide (TPR) repeat protein